MATTSSKKYLFISKKHSYVLVQSSGTEEYTDCIYAEG